MSDKTECNHQGNFKSAGVVPIQTREGLDIITVMYCKKCGAGMRNLIQLRGLATPPPGMPMDLSKFNRK